MDDYSHFIDDDHGICWVPVIAQFGQLKIDTIFYDRTRLSVNS